MSYPVNFWFLHPYAVEYCDRKTLYSIINSFMNRRQNFRRSYTHIAAYFLTIVIVLISWGGPDAVRGAVVSLRIDGQPDVIVSGHRFSCNWRKSSDNLNQCRTRLKGRILEVEFIINKVLSPNPCSLKYNDRLFTCSGFNDVWLGQDDAVKIWVGDTLGLTQFDRWWILLNNPLANLFGNLSESEWDRLELILAWIVSILTGVGIWLDWKRWSLPIATLFSLVTVPLMTPVVRWCLGLLVWFSGHVD